jgi:uroporphyrinogen-III synthase
MTRVWVTRDEEEGGELCTALAGAGLVPVWHPVLARRLCEDVLDVVGSLREDDWLVLTSRYAIESIPSNVVRSRVAVVGQASADAARAKGWRVERESPDGSGRGLWDSLRADPAGATKMLYPRSSLAPIPRGIPGVRLVAPVLYETEERRFDPRVAREVDVVSVASPSAAEVVCEVVEGLGKVAALGPTTVATLRDFEIEPWLEVKNGTFEDFAGAIAEKAR